MNLRCRSFLLLRPESRHRSVHAATQTVLHNLPGHGVGTHVQAAVTLHTAGGPIQVANDALSAALQEVAHQLRPQVALVHRTLCPGRRIV